MTTTILDQVPANNPNFKATQDAIRWESPKGTRWGVLCTATEEATDWDGAPKGSQAIWLTNREIWVYARVFVQDRTQERTHTGGLRGKACQIQMWNSEDGWSEKIPAVLFSPGG